jgi:low temperature requirement protein LtrA
MAEREQRVTPLELFFDLVFVFGLTQVTNFMSDDPTWAGLGRGLLLLAVLWFAWSGYAWLTNALEPEELPVRVAIVAAMAALLVVALAVPEAFDEHGVLFAVAYLVVRVLHIVLYTLAGKRDPDLLWAVVRFAPSALLASAILVLAGFMDGSARPALWVVALAIDYAGVLIGRGERWRISPAHFAERYGLIVIIALGESIVSIGIGAAGVELTPSIVAAAVLGTVTIATVWWAYFDIYAVQGQRQLAALGGAPRGRYARDYYTYLHLPMIGGIVFFALGLKKTFEHVGDPLATVPAVALCGGLALFFFTHVVMRILSVRALVHTPGFWTARRPPSWFGLGRPTATVVLLALIPVALEVSALTSLALVTGLCCALIAYDVMHYREERAEIRAARPW